jgi:hypothetical protein
MAATMAAFGQRENLLPMKGSSLTTDTMRVIKDNQSALMLRSTWQGDLYDSLSAHTDTLQALRADIDAGGSSLLLDSINQHRIEIDNLHDSIAAHRTELDNHTDSIADHRAELDNLTDSIADHRTELNANTSQISSNGTNISTNSVGILDNQNDIASLEDSISKHTDTLQVHQDQIAALFDTAAIHLDTLQEHNSRLLTLEGAAIGGYWTRTGTDLSPTTAGDDINLATSTEQITFNDGDTRIYEASDDNLYFNAGTTNFNIAGSWTMFWKDILAQNSSVDIGSAGTRFQTIYGATINGTAVNAVNITSTGLLSPDSTNIDLGNYITFGNGSGYIYAPLNNALVLGANGSNVLTLDGSDNWITGAFRPSLNSLYDLGTSARFWQATYTDSVIIDNTSNYITEDGSNNMVFNDAVTGSKTLAELAVAAGNGWGATTTNTTTHTTIETTGSNDDVITIAGLRGSDSASIMFDPYYSTDGPLVEIAATSSGTKEMYLQMSNYNGLILNKEGIGWMSVGSDSISFNWQGGGINEGVVRDRRSTTQGLVYYADYSADYTDRSLIDKQYVDETIPEYGTISTVSATTYTFVLGDAQTLIVADYNGGQGFSVPPNSSVAFPIGTRIRISKTGTSGNVNINEGTGVTINHWESSPAVRNMGTGELIKIDTDEWMLTGDIIQDA